MTEERQFSWVDVGLSSVALTDELLSLLVAKKVISPNERDRIIDAAITKLNSNPEFQKAADSLKAIFLRP